jgi:hypothetical protein
MKPARFLLVSGVALAFVGAFGCYAVQPSIYTRQIFIPRGMRAVSLRTRVSSTVEPGSRVDVLLPDCPDAGNNTVLEELTVLASERSFVTVLTTPKEAGILANCLCTGRF